MESWLILKEKMQHRLRKGLDAAVPASASPSADAVAWLHSTRKKKGISSNKAPWWSGFLSLNYLLTSSVCYHDGSWWKLALIQHIILLRTFHVKILNHIQYLSCYTSNAKVPWNKKWTILVLLFLYVGDYIQGSQEERWSAAVSVKPLPAITSFLRWALIMRHGASSLLTVTISKDG